MYLCVDLDAFFVSVEQALNPELKGKPVIVGGLPQERGVVASASYEARKFGIHSAMPTARAYQLCPQAIFLRGNYHNYEEYSEAFHKILKNYSPAVKMVSIDEAYINIKGTERLLGPPLIIALKIKNEIRSKLNIPVSIGISATRVIAKIACDRSKPDGLILVKPGEEKEFLAPLEVGAFPGIGPKHKEILNRLNINTIGELLKSPDWIAESALGNYYKVIKFFIEGGDYHGYDGIKSISRETTLNQDSSNKNIIYALFIYLIERSCNTLREKKMLARTLSVKVRFADFKTVSKRCPLPETNAQQTVYEQGAPILESLLAEKKRIRLVGIALSRLVHDGMQPSIFKLEEERLKRLNNAMDRARDKFGFGCLTAAKTHILKKQFRSNKNGYTLHTPSLSQ
ncbi:hypothetical protein A2Y85_08170 [candidate division WOR-3 bacterium RBG_13_43_14]|uniref:DNA polymerase IV n=1 Tax=candidate division WOR-3 bacterium RBG_13_43_14 TaxID=1802590 RepID=A0A1F4U6V2_UNCW3|nr:MAG: hypothetical protein A2Y85_08170 [candidate division WOR-3 bacterium RBG_13_43_14]